MRSLTWQNVWAERLARHSLLDRTPAEGLVDLVGAVCGIHAQVMIAAELSIGIQVDDVTRRDVQAALWEKRDLVKTFGIRGTLHLFPSKELPLWMAALRARAALDPKRYESIGLDRRELQAILKAMAESLDGRQLTIKQLGERVVEHAGSWAGETTSQAWNGAWPRWRKALGEAAINGILCYGPPQGTEVTFVRADQWTGNSDDADPEEALAEVFRRYLRAYGPATTRDFAQWFNIPPRAARDLGAALADELEQVDVEGYRSYALAGDFGGAADTVAADFHEEMPVRLLPHFDCYVIGCHPRNLLLPPDWSERVPPRTIPSQLQTLLIDGTVAGVWERQTKGRRVEVRVEPFMSLDERQKRLLEEEACRIGNIMEMEATLAIGPVAVRPHL
ncbi:MAG: winged helix DNA-binding domain-containing protein [Chloroflexota bacterium]